MGKKWLQAGLAVVLTLALWRASRAQDPQAGGMPELKPLPQTERPYVPPDPEKAWSFFFIGDSRPAKASDGIPKVTKHFVKQLRALQPAFVLWDGDIIKGKDPNTSVGQYKDFLNLIESACPHPGDCPPIYVVPGNHEVDEDNEVCKDDPQPAMEALFTGTLGVRLYGAFTYGDCRFITIDTEEPPTPADASDKACDGNLSQTQKDALEADLDANTGRAHIFVIMHRPLKAKKAKMQLDAADAAYLTALFAAHPNVHFVLASHEHLYFNPQSPDNITTPPDFLCQATPQVPILLVSGGGGAPFAKDGGANAFHHYLKFEVAPPSGNCPQGPVRASIVKLK